MGCMSRVQRKTNDSMSLSKFHSDDFERLCPSTIQHPYLFPQSAIFRRIFVYLASTNGSNSLTVVGKNPHLSSNLLLPPRSNSNSNELAILGLFVCESTNVEEHQWMERVIAVYMEKQLREQIEKNFVDHNDDSWSLPSSLPAKAYIWLISNRRGMDTKPPLNRIYRKFCPFSFESMEKDLLDDNDLGDGNIDQKEQAKEINIHEKNSSNANKTDKKDTTAAKKQLLRDKLRPHWDVKFISSLSRSLSEACRDANTRLTHYLSSHAGPTLVIAQGLLSSQSPSLTATQWRSLLPSLFDFPLCVMPAHSTDAQPPAVGAPLFFVERMIQRFQLFPLWFQDRLLCARYANIPLCNFMNNQDSVMSMWDVLYARQCIVQRHVLWANEARIPDVGKCAEWAVQSVRGGGVVEDGMYTIYL
jgi:hypothetical protein